MIKISKFLIISFIIIILIIYPNQVKAISLDNIMGGADGFLEEGESKNTIDKNMLGSTSDIIYNVLLGISMVTAVIIGIILGIKYMTSASEDKAEIKQSLVPYVVACVIIFGAFTIWKFVINIIN